MQNNITIIRCGLLTEKTKQIKMVKILVFDTETTGLPTSLGFQWNMRQEAASKLDEYRNAWEPDKWPYILQLSYVMCDTWDLSAKLVNNYIDIPEDIQISEACINVHHITHEKIREADNKKTIADALNEFFADVETADVVVGHNVAFDIKMVVIELLRIGGEFADKVPDLLVSEKFECTMEKMTPICNLVRQVDYISKVDGKHRSFLCKKSPKLVEAYEYYFGYVPLEEALHDAIMDVVICLRVYLRLNNFTDICCDHPELRNYLQKMTPPEYWPEDEHTEEPEKTNIILRRSERIAQQDKINYKM